MAAHGGGLVAISDHQISTDLREWARRSRCAAERPMISTSGLGRCKRLPRVAFLTLPPSIAALSSGRRNFRLEEGGLDELLEVRRDQLSGGLAPPRMRPCWAQMKKPGQSPGFYQVTRSAWLQAALRPRRESARPRSAPPVNSSVPGSGTARFASAADVWRIVNRYDPAVSTSVSAVKCCTPAASRKLLSPATRAVTESFKLAPSATSVPPKIPPTKPFGDHENTFTPALSMENTRLLDACAEPPLASALRKARR